MSNSLKNYSNTNIHDREEGEILQRNHAIKSSRNKQRSLMVFQKGINNKLMNS